MPAQNSKTDAKKAGHIRDRLLELCQTAVNRDIFLFTDFLTEADAADALALAGAGQAERFGGTDDCERTVVRFGDPDRIGYSVDYPICLLHIAPAAKKFAEDLTHRDYLGAILNLGIERSVVGDIYLDGTDAYVFVLEHMAEYISENLTRVRHTGVTVSRRAAVPEACRPKLSHEEYVLSAPRADALIAKAFHMPRARAKSLIGHGDVSSGGRELTSASKIPAEGTRLSVRGHGKILYEGVLRETAKGKLRVGISRYC